MQPSGRGFLTPSIDTFIKVATAEEFLLPFSPYYAYPFTAEYYIGTADLRGVPGGRKNAWWIRESTKKMPYNFTATGALVFRPIVALVSRVYYGPSIGRAESNIGRYKRIKQREFTSPDEGAASRDGERVSFTINFITQFYRRSLPLSALFAQLIDTLNLVSTCNVEIYLNIPTHIIYIFFKYAKNLVNREYYRVVLHQNIRVAQFLYFLINSKLYIKASKLSRVIWINFNEAVTIFLSVQPLPKVPEIVFSTYVLLPYAQFPFAWRIGAGISP